MKVSPTLAGDLLCGSSESTEQHRARLTHTCLRSTQSRCLTAQRDAGELGGHTEPESEARPQCRAIAQV